MTYRPVNGSSAKLEPRYGRRDGKRYFKFNMSGLASFEETVPGGGGGGVSVPGMNKGDLISAIALDTTALLKVGFDGQFLMVDSVQPVGLKWTTLTLPESGILPSIVDARGDLIAGDAPDYVVRVPLGTNGHVLSADSTVLGGIKWIAPPSAIPADGSITDAMLRDSAATSVIGRSVATAGDPADISAITDGHVLRRAAGILAFGPLDLSDTDSITGTLPAGNLPATATSVDIPKSIVTTKGDLIAGDSAATPVRIGLGTNGFVLSADSTVTGGIKWIAPPSGTPPADSITNAMLRDSIAFSVIGKPDTGTGNPSDIGSAADNNVLRRSGAAIGWGAINLAGGSAAVTGILPAGNVAQPLAASNIPTIDISTAQVTGTLPVNKGGTGLATLTSGSLLVGAGTSPVTFKSLPLSASDVAAPAAGSITRTMLANGIANSVMGVAGNADAAVADIGSAADGNALRRSGTTLGFGPINLAGGASAITGTLPTGNMAAIDISTGSATGILPVSKGGTGVNTFNVPVGGGYLWGDPAANKVTLWPVVSTDGGGTGNITNVKGDLLVGSGVGYELAKLSVGANNNILTADSTQTSGLAWRKNTWRSAWVGAPHTISNSGFTSFNINIYLPTGICNYVGTIIRMYYAGSFSTGATVGQLNIYPGFGGMQSGFIVGAPPTGMANNGWSAEFVIIVRTIGSAATISTQYGRMSMAGYISPPPVSTALYNPVNNTQDLTVSIGCGLICDMTYTGGILTLANMWVEVQYPDTAPAALLRDLIEFRPEEHLLAPVMANG